MKARLFILLLIVSLKLSAQTTFNLPLNSIPSSDKTVIHIGDTLKTTDTQEVFIWNGGVWSKRPFSGNWSDLKGKPILLKGDQGIQGIKGDKGDQGITGIQGIQGLTGNQGAAGINATPMYSNLTNGATAISFGTNTCAKVTPTATASFTTTVPSAGVECTLIVLTNGTVSYTITFSTGFKPVSTLATGTTSGKYFTITFISDGTNLIETGRTAAH